MTGLTVGAVNVMEQRWSQRRKVALDVDIWRQGSALASSRTRDVGLGGVFLEVEGGRVLEKNTEVDLFFLLEAGDHVTRHKLKARVVRITVEGFGLMFKDFDIGAFRALQEILRHTPR